MSTETTLSPDQDLRRAVIRSVKEAEVLHAHVLSAAEHTAAWLTVASQAAPLNFSLRFVSRPWGMIHSPGRLSTSLSRSTRRSRSWSHCAPSNS
jgi:hypothetical protein